MFIPATRKELERLGWTDPDIILITGDSYIDSPFVGISMIGHILMDAGYKVAIIPQPDIESDKDITRFGEPRLFWGITSGCIDSMVANYTANGRKRKSDDYTAGNVNNRRPDRAVIVYSNLIRRYFKNTVPLVLGGIEASLRRIVHYDYWSNKLRRSILFDAKADYLLYGMSDRTVVQLTERLQNGESPADLPGLCHISSTIPDTALVLPAWDQVKRDKAAFTDMFMTFYQEQDPKHARPLAQLQDTRYLVQNPPAPYLRQTELDRLHALPFERDLHPHHRQQGPVKALDTIQFSIPTHRGCYGECHFCSIAVHQGRTVRWRSMDSVTNEARTLTQHPNFKGRITDLGGPTANMYGFECAKKLKSGACRDKRCLYPAVCNTLQIDHQPQIDLLRRMKNIPDIKSVYVSSGIRYDMVLADKQHGRDYLNEIVRAHVSGQLKIAPEHSEPNVLAKMGKPPVDDLVRFVNMFYDLTRKAGKDQYLTYYLIAAHPGCREQDMHKLKQFAARTLKVKPRQIQIFTPTPSTLSTLMYYTERDPFTGNSCFVDKDRGRESRNKSSSDDGTRLTRYTRIFTDCKAQSASIRGNPHSMDISTYHPNRKSKHIPANTLSIPESRIDHIAVNRSECITEPYGHIIIIVGCYFLLAQQNFLLCRTACRQ
ncbi:MAG: YgiQ family radical SAM protein [candidate division KSB1 bacterium]|nr:YgiQ family radical SAM protein [candidate division KSB1 bacterium]